MSPIAPPRDCHRCRGTHQPGEPCPKAQAEALAYLRLARPFVVRQPDHRPSASARGYGAKWRKESQEWLQRQGRPLCAYCGRVPATLVDHRIAHKGDHRLFWSRENWIPACRSCNSRKAATSEGGFGNRGGAASKL